MPPAGSPLPPANRALHWIGALQLFKGLLLIALALGFLSFLHQDVDELVAAWMTNLGINIENRHIVAFLEMLDRVTDKQLFQYSLVAFAFSGVLLTQGTGLLLRRRWAKYLTLIATSLLIPFEGFELAKGFGFIKLGVLVVNVIIVGVMIWLLRRGREMPAQASAAASASSPGVVGEAV